MIRDWRRLWWRFVAGIAYEAASACFDLGGWAMGHLPEGRLARESAARIWKAIEAREGRCDER